MSTTKCDRISGALYGLAFGDAYGYLVEFTRYPQIVRRYGRIGPDFPRRAIVSDDTQMSLALWHALDFADLDAAASVAYELGEEFLDWAVDPDNTRAPGATCLAALGRLADGRHWTRASMVESKGCGTVMRAPWIGLHPCVTAERVSDIAQLQAAMTHGHPTAVVAADVLAQLTRELADQEITPADAVDRAVELAATVEYSPWLCDLYRLAGYRSAEDYVAAGVTELLAALDRIGTGVAALVADPLDTDPCELTGEGWIAEEALATALLVVQVYGGSPQGALRRAATTGGDSDSIAAIVGALLGAAYGEQAWPLSWTRQLEPRYRRELAAARAQTREAQVA